MNGIVEEHFTAHSANYNMYESDVLLFRVHEKMNLQYFSSY